jgi:hypothetical protein
MRKKFQRILKLVETVQKWGITGALNAKRPISWALVNKLFI